ncbi:hypothetical protein [Inhella proteolytica]|uniref:Uncharacterized protein n=1 Tax=Inhella proteolytica TaxID=2795029 RepID=A0A931NFA9_9BURK|nr:hypothetical protein [Inhella proteolytica]MBH9575911.1 hypothetical protein [Inhella proteolytica]
MPLSPLALTRLRRSVCHLSDLPGHWRALSSQPRLDVLSLRPLEDEGERSRCFSANSARRSHARAARWAWQGVRAQQRVINITRAELGSRAGRSLAQQACADAIAQAQRQGVRVVQFSAELRRLFGADSSLLKQRFPGLLFCNGDNAAALLLLEDVQRALGQAFAGSQAPIRVLLLGSDSALAQALQDGLRSQGAVVLGCTAAEAARGHLRTLAPVDAVVVCSADPALHLDLARVHQLRRRQRRLLVIDGVAPPSMDAATRAACGDWVLHQQASRVQLPGLRWGLATAGLHGERRLLDARALEALLLHRALFQRQEPAALGCDWLQHGGLQRLLLGEALRQLAVQLDAPYSGSLRVRSFNLACPEASRAPVSGFSDTLSLAA